MAGEHPPSSSASAPTPSTWGRVETLSDGVFAIALTLLTLNVRLDRAPHETFAHAFRQTLPQLFAYALSFAVISLFWIGHHRLFAALASIDDRMVFANFAYLAIVALIPFPSQVLGSNDGDAGPVILYAAALTLAGLASAFLWEYARRRRLFDPDTPSSLVLHAEWRALSIAIVFVLSIPIAVSLGANWAEWTWILIAPFRLVLRRRFGSVREVSW